MSEAIRMSREIQVERINTKNEIILPEEEFKIFVNRHKLPIFNYEYETQFKTRKMHSKRLFTIFNGERICVEHKITHMPPNP